MNTHPWDLLYLKSGEPKPWTPEITHLLEEIMEWNLEHPDALFFHHLWVQYLPYLVICR